MPQAFWEHNTLDLALYHGDCRTVTQSLAPESVACVVTSPPYYGLRDYGLPPSLWGGDPACDHDFLGHGAKNAQPQRDCGHGGFGGPNVRATRGAQSYTAGTSGAMPLGSTCRLCGAWLGCFGMEPTPALYVAHMVEVFRSVRRVLHPHGTVWLNLGDSYAGGGGGNYSKSRKQTPHGEHPTNVRNRNGWLDGAGVKPKDLLGVPWRAAFALQDDGWFLRADIVWQKPNVMCESVRDRPTKSHEYVFLLSRSAAYYYDADAVLEPSADQTTPRKAYTAVGTKDAAARATPMMRTRVAGSCGSNGFRNARSVWTIPTQPYHGAHFATFPVELARRCVLAGCPSGARVLDPFCGTAAAGVACALNGRRFAGIDLSADYLELATRRLEGCEVLKCKRK